jgi:ankyrin repeat protein
MGPISSSQKKHFEEDTGQTVDEWRKALAQGNEKAVVRLLQSPRALSLSTVLDKKTMRTALHVASLRGNYQCVDCLLAAGASVKAKDAVGQTALMLASSRGHDECVGSLLRAGSSVNAVDHDGQSPLHLSCGWRGETAVLCSKSLIDYGAHVDAQDCSGWAPLHWACREGVPACVDLLLKHGANKHVQSNLSWTPLHEAAREGHAQCVLLLLEAKASPNSLDTTMTSPLVDALQGHHLDCANLLLSHGASSNGPGVGEARHKRPLHVALKMNYLEAVELLFKFGANPLLKSPSDSADNFQSAFDLIKTCNQATKEAFEDCCWRYHFSHNNQVRSLLNLSRIAVRIAVCPVRMARVHELQIPPSLKLFIRYNYRQGPQ